ncbi:MAG: MnmC family methyltransferase [Candidatus Omnitrophota bacterium]
MIYNISMIITAREFELIKKHKGEKEFFLSVDFGTKVVAARREGAFVVIDNRHKLPLESKVKSNFCYRITGNSISPIAFFSQDTNRYYKLLPTRDWPSFTIGSVPMHRVSCGSPRQDSLNKINLSRPRGVVLDTCMGLGYTAILSSSRSDKVYTFEIDRTVYVLAKMSPLSQELFKRENIIIYKKDISQYIKEFAEDFFDCIIHDPPTFKLSPQLYSRSFYQQLYRVLKDNGNLFHYLPLYGVRRGINFPRQIIMKLKTAGFTVENSSCDNDVLCRKKKAARR